MELEAPPEAQLIARKRKALRPTLSMLEAARRAGMSATRWRQLETGSIRVKGADYPERAPADTLARMAWVTGATAAELCEAGRPDAAEELERLPDGSPDHGAHDEVRAIIDQIASSKVLTERQRKALIDQILADTAGNQPL